MTKAIISILCIIIASFAVVGCAPEYKCIKAVAVCEQSYKYMSLMYFGGAIWMPYTMTGYREVDCSGEYDRIVEKCVAWAEEPESN